MQKDQETPFFVGYLPTPEGLKKFYWPLVVILLACCTLLGYWLGNQQKSDVPAIWDVGIPTTMEGVLTLDPYPVLHRIHPDDPDRIESVLLVNQGKYSADQLSSAYDGQGVSITGSLISRGGWSMLEVGSAENFASNSNVDSEKIQSALAVKSLGEVSLSGEIADSKCFLGVMKPGAGKIHKACAEVCLLGGIPSMLVAKSNDGNKYGYVLIQADGSAASVVTAPHVAEPVTITGELQQRGDLLYIRMAENGLERI